MNLQSASTLQNRVSQLRKSTGETQVDLADAVGVTRQTIISVEKGDYVPSVLLAMKIADHFKTTVEKVFHV